MSQNLVTLAIADGIARIGLNRPEKLNSFNSDMHAALRDTLEACAENDAVRVVILTGEGRAFSAGQDLTVDLPRDEAGQFDLSIPLARDYNPLILMLANFPKVTIAALNGPAVGASMNIALACDIVLATRSAYLQEGFAKIALVPDAGGTWILPRLVGLKRALALCLTADPVTAEEAAAMGLVYKVYDDATFAGEVAALARRMVAGPASALKQIKQALNASLDNDLPQQLDLELKLQFDAGRHPDFMEGVLSFREKRAPVFK
ncbi:MAG: enoyl-CoA hydratase/isomerase family protein [Beijerinckiaceae bacterium]|nr:enoyl-CoA hydratase/isomerase family protein [Beijerinckiaceae bacterium]